MLSFFNKPCSKKTTYAMWSTKNSRETPSGGTFNETSLTFCSPVSSPSSFTNAESYQGSISPMVTNNKIEVKSDDGAEHSPSSKLEFSGLSHRNKYTLMMCASAMFFKGCSYAILAPFFPIEASKKGVSNTMTGSIFSLFELVIFLSSPFYGNYMTRIGPKFMYTAGVFVGGTCSILFGTLDKCPPGTIYVVMCILCRAVEALGMSAFTNASFAIVSNEFPNHIATVFGILETSNGIGMMVGPAIGGVLYTLGGYGTPFFVMGGLVILNGVIMFFFLPAPTDVPTKRTSSLLSLVTCPSILLVVLSVTVCALGLTFLDPTLANHLTGFQLRPSIVSLFFVIGPFMYAVTSPILGYLCDVKHLQEPVLVIGYLLMGIGFLCMGPSLLIPFLEYELWTMVVSLIILGVAIGCSIVSTMKVLVLTTIDLGFENNIDTFAIVSGLFNSAFYLGAFTGPVIGGILVDEFGFPTSSTIIGIICLAVTAIAFPFFLVRRLRKKYSQQKDQVKVNYMTISEDS